MVVADGVLEVADGDLLKRGGGDLDAVAVSVAARGRCEEDLRWAIRVVERAAPEGAARNVSARQLVNRLAN
ncbi:hypothetical protein HNR73_006388 [Phytomonospora endophytica]|uniref:Uncharacterized protein n=1 Tax=Phytomonospora endophytica TaxID=714109 RepID=A0A841FQS3_9ACTN|nr:hypothetical protein [Phytomonospora endophytica]GIG64435.1 hypothetical protein Pen01_07300 [Phytomonospora endophytica]